MNQQLLKTFSPLHFFNRSKGYRHPGGVRYPGGIKYYPRDENYVEPDITPSKLFRVERIKPVKNNSWRLKTILKELKIDEEERVTIVKNIPEVNARLWKIKHLIKVTPITFPYGEPSKDDIKHTLLKENGECIVIKQLEPNPKAIEALDKFDSNPKKMDSTTIKLDSRLKWVNPLGGGF
ncbi:hypothetical protein JYU34_010897 [Plutella xylostella]|uniref:Uncharacterized protein n=2 Tax=Plutella xylostella TaxID=51655 RepID=A0ABQ7QFJ4_PLUXY|nr:hypothetical protein JYU34_010897 [Plutella xylostella]CAG9110173.1 unnamed protein product [Plutella xylostella]